jgi:hypothetical protein
MILILAILFICLEAIGEALIKKHYPTSFIFKGWLQWVIAIALFLIWFVIAYRFDKYYVETWKLITGFIFVRFAIFDLTYNLTAGLDWDYYGTTKLYDRIMYYFGGWGFFIKGILGICGIVFLMGWS